jgi:multidrug efflux pump
MKMMDGLKERFKEFKPTSWAVNNTTVIYILAILITFYGLNRFNNLPKEQFPDIVVPTISITTVYVGNSPSDIENLITRPLEKQIKSISGAKVNKVNSVSQQDFSLIIVEFDTDIKTDIAKQKVKDAADKARVDLPADLTSQPDVQEFAFSEMPIMFLNVSGDYDEIKLKQFADKIQDRVEEIKEITRADIVGAPEREIQVNVDPYKMQVAKVSFNDIENAISRENNDISGGQVEVGNMKRTLRVKGQFNTALDMQNIVIKNIQGAPIYLRDIAEVKDTVRERESYARLDGKNVVTLNIIKRSGENLIDAADNVKASIEEMKQKQELPPDLRVEFTGDQSISTKHSFNELVNTIIIGFILVLLVLMFFMGVTNAFFVALKCSIKCVCCIFIFTTCRFYCWGTRYT